MLPEHVEELLVVRSVPDRALREVGPCISVLVALPPGFTDFPLLLLQLELNSLDPCCRLSASYRVVHLSIIIFFFRTSFIDPIDLSERSSPSDLLGRWCFLDDRLHELQIFRIIEAVKEMLVIRVYLVAIIRGILRNNQGRL